MTLIPARVPYTPPELGAQYNRTEVRTALGKLSLSVPPMTTRTVTAATIVNVADDLIVCDTTGGNFAATLPAPAQVQFLRVSIINIGSGTLTITGTVSGAVNPTLAQWKSAILQTDGVRWMKIGGIV